MTKLSTREVVLLSVLLFIMVFGLGILYWINPMIANIEALESEKSNLEVQEIEMRTRIAQTGKLMENREQLLDDVDALMNELSDPLKGESFDRLTQSLARDRKIKIQSVSYGAASVVAPSAQSTPVQTYEFNLKELLNTYLNYSPSEVTGVSTDHQILKQSLVIEVEGSYANLQRFVGDLSNVGQTNYIKNVSYTRNDHEIFDDEGNPTDTETQESASIEIDVYFLNKEIPGGWVGK